MLHVYIDPELPSAILDHGFTNVFSYEGYAMSRVKGDADDIRIDAEDKTVKITLRNLHGDAGETKMYSEQTFFGLKFYLYADENLRCLPNVTRRDFFGSMEERYDIHTLFAVGMYIAIDLADLMHAEDEKRRKEIRDGT